ncbi:hypothetical protein DWZ31_18405 [Roseburia intestinalis]|jgi:hypothetical protein|uniref:Uncharacterized protein n=1 Tax=Roseburia intestinalis TaxID=166486 RepID=A0A415TNH6_9FIRM|nr:hypothetical protein [Roseburia intestinalis]NSC35221.1 hypothetical protein [Roseburia intestinalis]RHN03493.1 hypothetical protein DWZ31_18405 [Roseburia intestinalis]
MRKTNANRLLKAITNNLVSVTSAVVNHDEGMKEPISVEKFKEDLEFYVNSGIFADTIDFTYEKIAEDRLLISIGKASCYCYDDIDVTLQLNDGVTIESVTKQLYEDFSERLSA